MTCGGLEVVGWLVCSACGRASLDDRSKSCESVDWKISKGGRSVDAGRFRIRAEGDGDVAALMERIKKLPQLELELEALRSQRNDAR